MRIHAIMCTYLGDGELDIGKTSRWVQWFTDSLFFYDANPASTTRRYVVDYSKTWPEAQVAYHPTSAAPFQVQPEVMRQMAFQAADSAWRYDADDWVIYVDGTEGISTDVPHDALELLSPTSSRFRYLYDEIDAATDPYLGCTIRTFLRQGTVTENDYLIQPALGDVPANHALWWSCDPHYLTDTSVPAPRHVLRLARVDWLRTAPLSAFVAMDTFNLGTYSLCTHVGFLTYAYARYSEVDYHDPSLWVEENDEGWTNRLFMQSVPGRNIPPLPVVYSTPDPVGYPMLVPPGPATITVYDNMTVVEAFDFTGHVTRESGNETYTWVWGDGSPNSTGQTITHTFPTGQNGPWTVTLSVADPDVPGGPRTASVIMHPGTLDPIEDQPTTPPGTPPSRMLSAPYCYYMNQIRGQYVMAFGALWRLNPRDGVWYQQLDLGPPPIDPVTGDPAVDPALWAQQRPNPNTLVTVPNEPGPGV